MQFPHGVVGQATRNRTSSSALPQARVPPTNRRRCQEYDGLTASTPLGCMYCVNSGLRLRRDRYPAYEHTKTPAQGYGRHRRRKHFINALDATGRRRMPGIDHPHTAQTPDSKKTRTLKNGD
ncbi:hypothetical protein TcCL_Unassigned01286 [Trypanosoma cruzi]|nr:hypothetical protein TcCL_Unassigned01286 [Trypanosoma cruzi]